MANKYISHGNTYDGDGTTSADASSAGGVGAWNDLIAIMTAAPTYGTIAAGDVVNIRSYISADINITVTASKIMIAVGTQDAPIWWVMDDGTIWPTGGTLTMTWTANYYWRVSDHNHLIGKNYNWVLHHTLTSRKAWIYTYQQFIKDIKVSCVNGTGYCYIYQNGRRTIWYNSRFELSSAESYGNIRQTDYNTLDLLGCEFDLSGMTTTTIRMIELTSYHGGSTYLLGCSITGGKDTHYVWGQPTRGYPEQIYISHTNFEPMSGQNQYYASSASVGANGIGRITDIPGSKFGALLDSSTGYCLWDNGKNYPTLNAQLPDVSLWSIKCFLVGSDSYEPLVISTSSKQNNATAAVRKVIANVLIDDDFDTPKDDKWWMEVCWVDASGNSQVQTTRALYNEQTLTVSSAGWNAEVYGEKNYTRYKFEITTTAAIKQYTDVIVYVYTEYSHGGTNNFVFADPDFALETI